MGKVLDRILHKKITNYLEENNKITELQFGFIKLKSADLHLARVVNKAMINNINRVTYVTVVDIEKAYDTIWKHHETSWKTEHSKAPTEEPDRL